MFKFDKVYVAEVKDNNDTLREGRVKIYIEPIMWGWDTKLYPWARPFFNSIGSDYPTTFGESNIPEEDTKVWVWFEDDQFKKNAFYITNTQLKDLNPHKLFQLMVQPSLSTVTVPLTAQYPDVKFKILKNGMAMFHSTSPTAKEMGVYHSPISYYVIDNAGNHNISAPLATFTGGSVSIATGPLIVASVQSPSGSDLTLTTQTASDNIIIQAGTTPPPQPSVLGTEFVTEITSLLAAISSLNTACTQLASAVAGLNPIAQTPASAAGVIAAIAAVGASSSSVASATSQLPNTLSTKVLHN